MNIFDSIVQQRLLIESVETLGRDELDPSVFQPRMDGVPILRDSVKVQILKNIDEIRAVIPVDNFYVVGGILSRNYQRNTEIQIIVKVDAQLVDSISTAELMHLLTYINGKMAADTMHPINYYITTDDIDSSVMESVYDVINEKWIKSPRLCDQSISSIILDLEDTLDNIDLETGELKQDQIDIEELMSLDITDAKRLRVALKRKQSQLQELLKHLTMNYNINFQFTTPEELINAAKEEMLPSNILQKILEFFYCSKFIDRVEKILDEKNELEFTNTQEIKQAVHDAWKIFQHI
jgi:hypothetical protein